MKKILFIILFLFSSTSFAYQCPQFKDFYQDKNNIWHLKNIPPAPEGSYWKPLTQGPLASSNHKLDSIDVMLTYGTWQDRVSCGYGHNGNIFMAVNLHVEPNQKPYPSQGSNFQGDIPNECFVSAENCEFEIKGSKNN